MGFRDLKITLLEVKGNCSRCIAGTVMEVRNLKLHVPDCGLCLFALGALVPNLTAAVIKADEENDILKVNDEFQCPDPFAVVRFKVEPLEA